MGRAGGGIRRIAGSTDTALRRDRAKLRSTALPSRERTQVSPAGSRRQPAPPAAQTEQTPPCCARLHRGECVPTRHRRRLTFRWKEAWVLTRLARVGTAAPSCPGERSSPDFVLFILSIHCGASPRLDSGERLSLR